MKTASDKVSDTKSFDDELEDDFLTSWKPSKMRLDAGLDLDEGVNSKASRKKFTLSKLDMDFDFDGGFGKLADFDVDLSGLDLPSSPVKKSTSGKKAVEKLVERKQKSEDTDDDFDFNEFKTFGMDDSFLNKKPEGRLHGQTFDLAEIKTIPNSSSCQQNARRTTSIAFSDDLFSTDQDKKEVNLQGLEKSSEVELNNTRLSAKDIIADSVSHSAESGKDADKTERSGAVQSSQNSKTINNWTEKEDAPPFDQTVAKLTTKPSDPQVNSIGRSHDSREVSFTAFTEKAHKLEVCAFDSLMGLREAQEDAILTSNFKSTDEARGVTSTNSKVPPPQSSVAADDHDATRLEKSTNFVESDKQLVKSILTNRRTSSLNQESEEKLSNLVLCDEDPKNNDLKRRDSCGTSNVACQNADLNGNIPPPNQRDEDSTGKTGRQELLSEDRSVSAHEHGHPPHSLKDDDDFVTNANYVPHEAATTSSKSPDDSVLHQKEIPGVPRPAEFNKAETNSKSWEPLADELVKQETRCEQLPAVNTLDVIPQILAKSLHGPAVSCANDSQVQVISIPSTVHLKSPSSVAALR